MQGMLCKVKNGPDMPCYSLPFVQHGSLGFYHAALCKLACRIYMPSICRVGFIDRWQLCSYCSSAWYNWKVETLTT